MAGGDGVDAVKIAAVECGILQNKLAWLGIACNIKTPVISRVMLPPVSLWMVAPAFHGCTLE